jgi:hypothetical protein
MPSEIISERRATSNRNGARDHPGIPGDFPRNPQVIAESARAAENGVVSIVAPSNAAIATERAVVTIGMVNDDMVAPFQGSGNMTEYQRSDHRRSDHRRCARSSV